MARIGYIVVTFEFKQEPNRWLGRCLQLGTATYGDTFEEVREDLTELIALHLNSLEGVGERKRFFSENGIRLYRHKPAHKQSRLQVPISEDVVTQRQLVHV